MATSMANKAAKSQREPYLVRRRMAIGIRHTEMELSEGMVAYDVRSDDGGSSLIRKVTTPRSEGLGRGGPGLWIWE
jgi:hypothetical protein